MYVLISCLLLLPACSVDILSVEFESYTNDALLGNGCQGWEVVVR